MDSDLMIQLYRAGAQLTKMRGLMLFSLIFALGMAAYGRVYVSALALDEQSGTLRASTVRLIGSRELVVPVADVIGSGYRAGPFVNPAGASVNAPWISLRVKGRHWPLIIDAQGEFTDRGLAARVLKFR